MVQPGGLVCHRTRPVQLSLLLFIPYCLLAFSGLVMANCSLGESALVRSCVNVIFCFPPIFDYFICYSSEAGLFCNLFPYFGYLHGYILPPSCDSRGRHGIYSLLWPSCHPPVPRAQAFFSVYTAQPTVFTSFTALSCVLGHFFNPCLTAFTLLSHIDYCSGFIHTDLNCSVAACAPAKSCRCRGQRRTVGLLSHSRLVIRPLFCSKIHHS